MQQGGEDRISEREPIDDRFIPVRLEAIVDAVTPDAQSAGVSAVAVTKFVDALRASGGIKKRAAQLVGVSFRSFRYRIEKLGLDHNQDES